MMADTHDRRMRILLWALIAAMALLVLVNRAKGQVTASFHPQPRPSKHVRVWNAVVCNDSPEAVTVNHALLSRYAVNRLALLNVYARTYEQGRTPKHIVTRIGDTLEGLSDGWVTGVATEVIKYDGKITIAAAVYSGFWKIAGNAYRETRNLSLTAQPFWDDRPVQVAGGACVEAAVAALRPEDKTARRAQEANSIEVQIPVNPPLSRLAWPQRFDAIDWDRQAAEAMREIVTAACVIRPSSVEDEGCGAWWANARGGA